MFDLMVFFFKGCLRNGVLVTKLPGGLRSSSRLLPSDYSDKARQCSFSKVCQFRSRSVGALCSVCDRLIRFAFYFSVYLAGFALKE